MDNYAVFGNPIAHSKSPLIHRLFAEQTEQALLYQAQHVELNNFAGAVAEFFAAGGLGINITVPFKGQAWKAVDDCSLGASKAKAVNTIKQLENGDLFGANTDGIGLCNDLQNNLNWPIHNQRILVIGAGGAARGVLMPLLNCQPELLAISNRTMEKARSLAIDFEDSGAITALERNQLKREQFDLVINASSTSLNGELPQVPASMWSERTRAYDMFYGSADTVFVRWAKEHKVATAADGLGMLVEQAAEAFELWRGVRPVTMDVIQVLREHLASS